MDIEHYRRRLLEEHERLVALTDRTKDEAREATPDPIHDRTDGPVLGELKDELFRESEAHWTTLRRVREALQRIADGTYGRCLADEQPIDPARLEAAPWVEYCLRHEQEREQSEGTRTPGL
jgi:RNA polymerase-binding transcription factor